MIESIPSPVQQFGFEATEQFTIELGSLPRADALIVTEFLKRVISKPYDPFLIRECSILDKQNTILEYELNERLTVAWKVLCVRPYSIDPKDWRVRFNKIKIQS